MADEARRIARLAHIEMSDEVLDRLAADMTRILDYIDHLKEVDVHLVPVGETAVATPMRDDEPQQPTSRELVARNAPEWSDGFFVVPKVIGE